MTKHPVAAAFDSTAALIRMGWCQGASAQTDRGSSCDPRSPDARSWCLSGAMLCCSLDAKVLFHARTMLRQHLGQAIEHWNDSHNRTIDQVLVKLAEVSMVADTLPPIEEMVDAPTQEVVQKMSLEAMVKLFGYPAGYEYELKSVKFMTFKELHAATTDEPLALATV